jgi:hypothetical protein
VGHIFFLLGRGRAQILAMDIIIRLRHAGSQGASGHCGEKVAFPHFLSFQSKRRSRVM